MSGDSSLVTFVRLSDGSSLGYSQLEVAKAQEIDGRQVVPAKFLLTTSVKRKLLNIYLSENRNLLFALTSSPSPVPRISSGAAGSTPLIRSANRHRRRSKHSPFAIGSASSSHHRVR